MKTWLVRILALVVFGVSFALPAVRLSGGSPGASPIPGWTCAVFASILGPKSLVQSIGQGVRTEDVLIVVSGLVNYLFLAIVVLSFWRRLVRTRLVVGALTLLCFVAAWFYFALSQTTPLVGHYLWFGGAILLLVPDLARFFSRTGAGTAVQESAGRAPAGR
jgi:hypothetical protein